MADLSDGLQTCQSDLHKFRGETNQSLNRLVSELDTSVRSQPVTDHHFAEIKLLVTSLETRLQNVAELMKGKLDTSRLHSALTDLQVQRPDKVQETCQPDNLTAIISHSEGLTTEILDLKKRIAETLSETNEAKAETLKCLVEIRAIEARLKSDARPVGAMRTRDQAHEPKRGRPARQDKPKKNPKPTPAALNNGSKSVDQRSSRLEQMVKFTKR